MWFSPSVSATSRADTFLLAVAPLRCIAGATSPDAFFECQSGAAETRFAGLRCVLSEEGNLIRRCGAAPQSSIEPSAVCLKADRQTNGFAALAATFPKGEGKVTNVRLLAPSDEGAGCALAQTEGEKPIDRYTYAVFEA